LLGFDLLDNAGILLNSVDYGLNGLFFCLNMADGCLNIIVWLLNNAVCVVNGEVWCLNRWVYVIDFDVWCLNTVYGCNFGMFSGLLVVNIRETVIFGGAGGGGGWWGVQPDGSHNVPARPVVSF